MVEDRLPATIGSSDETIESSGLLDAAKLASGTPRQLLATYESLLVELRRREVVRTNDAPSGQYAEWLAHQVLGGELALNSVKSYDLVTVAGERVQVKARVVRHPAKAGERQLSPFRSFDFDTALVLLFDARYSVRRAVTLPAAVVFEHSRMSTHVNGRILIARDSVLALGADETEQFVAASE
jgi:hypothetical protein